MPRYKTPPTPQQRMARIQALIDRKPSRWEVAEWLGWNIGRGADGPFTKDRAEAFKNARSLSEYVRCECIDCGTSQKLPKGQVAAGKAEERCYVCLPPKTTKGQRRQSFVDAEGKRRWRTVA